MGRSCGDLLAEAKGNPDGVGFDDALKLAESYGFTRRGKGGHNAIFKRKGFLKLLNFQPRKDGKAKGYQVRQLLDAIEELEGGGDSEPKVDR